jgi:LysM repeat protein
MFTVFNRDVIQQISITAFLFFILFTSTVLARSGKIIHEKKIEYFGKNKTTYESYEKHPKVKVPYNKNEKRPKKRISSDAHYYKSSKKITKKTAPINNNIIRYTVQKGDTLTRISKKFNISVASIRSLNKLKNENNIKKGIILKIPATQVVSYQSQKRMNNNQTSYDKDKPRFQWPVNQVIDYRNDGLNGVKPIGIIITGKPGSTVLSSAPGTVKKIGTMRGFGKYIVIHHSGRYASVYANLDQIMVSEGDKIKAGNTIGRINFFDRKLHFQIDLEGKPENPLKYLPKNI